MISLFDDRTHAGRLLAHALRDEQAATPVVLAIPRGGIEVGLALASELSADLDVVLARKLRAPFQPELAVGAVSEDGDVFFTEGWDRVAGVTRAFIDQERTLQMAEIERRRAMYREVRPQVPLAGRRVIVTDDGIATGSTMIAALHAVRGKQAAHVTVAVPVAPPDRLDAIRPLCDRLVCLLAPRSFQAVGEFYRSFDQVEDERVVEILRGAASSPDARRPSSSP